MGIVDVLPCEGVLQQAGADFGTQPASPGPKANLVSSTTVGECVNQEPALVPSEDAVPGSVGSDEEDKR